MTERDPKQPPTFDAVAHWMLAQVERDGTLYQEEAVTDIEDRFGDSFIYENENGGTGICRAVLSAFRKISDEVVWERGERLWRKREPYDDPGRQQY